MKYKVLLILLVSQFSVADEQKVKNDFSSPSDQIDCKQFGGITDSTGYCRALTEDEQKAECAKNLSYKDSNGKVASGCGFVSGTVEISEKSE